MLRYSVSHRVGFAPIDIKIVKIKARDGFSNLVHSPTVDGVVALGAAIVPLTAGSMGISVPKGAHLTIAGDTTKYVVTDQVIDAVGADEVQTITLSGATAGTWDLVFSKPPGNLGTVSVLLLAFDVATVALQAAIDLAWAGIFIDGIEYVAGDIVATTVTSADITDVVITFSGGSSAKKAWPLATYDDANLTGGSGVISETTPGIAIGATSSVTILPLLVLATTGGEAVTFSGQEQEIFVGEGSTMTFDEPRAVDFFRKRGKLDSFRDADEEPMTASFAITYEFRKSISGTDIPPTLIEILRQEGNAADWVTTATGDCPGYAIDLVVENDPNCPVASQLGEETVLPQFLQTNISSDISTALITIDGSCNASKAIDTRKDLSSSSPGV